MNNRMRPSTGSVDLTRAAWRKSSRSAANANCVEVAFLPGRVAIRDSKAGGNGPTITGTDDQWRSLLGEVVDNATVRSDEWVTFETARNGAILLRAIEDGATLTFTASEWAAFLAGVQANEFDRPALVAGVS